MHNKPDKSFNIVLINKCNIIKNFHSYSINIHHCSNIGCDKHFESCQMMYHKLTLWCRDDFGGKKQTTFSIGQKEMKYTNYLLSFD